MSEVCRPAGQVSGASRLWTRIRQRAIAAAIPIFATLLLPNRVYADEVVPVAPALSGQLSLDEAVKLFRQRGLDLLIARPPSC